MRKLVNELMSKLANMLKGESKYMLLLVLSFIIIVVSAIVFFSQERDDSVDLFLEQYESDSLNVPSKSPEEMGYTNIKKFSDVRKEKLNETIRKIENETNATKVVRKKMSMEERNMPDPQRSLGTGTRIIKTPKPLPYPRISINYSVEKTSSIRSETTDDNHTFVIITLDIRNYGYKYFDAYPTKFKIVMQNKEIIPLVNISTGSMIDEVIPNNSRSKGDLIFILKKREASSIPKLTYIQGGYEILYKKISSSEMNREENKDDDNGDNDDDDYEEYH